VNTLKLNKIHIISYGSNRYFVRLSKNIISQISSKYNNVNFTLYTNADLPEKIVEYSKSEKRGYGYWIWKSYIISKKLNELNDGDILLYVDGRSSFKGNRISWLDKFIDNFEYDIALWSMNNTSNKEYTKIETMQYFDLETNQEYLKKKQYAAGIILIRNCLVIRSLFNDFYDLSWSNKHLVNDDNNISIHPEFITHRHDQSILNLLLFIYKELKIYDINDETIYNQDSILPHFYQHPTKGFFSFINFLPIKLIKLLDPVRTIIRKLKLILVRL
jgi:hypothetical protein